MDTIVGSVESTFATVDETVDLLRYLAEDISLRFDRWEDRYTRGPSLYFLVISEARVDSFVDPLGNNRWPTASARILPDDLDSTAEVGAEIAFDRDGAVVVAADGTFQEQMVRVRSLPDRDRVDVEHPDWMSAKHMSALEASCMDEVLAAVTLSEENGRVTVFKDGRYEDYERTELGGRWRVDSSDVVVRPASRRDDIDVDGRPTDGVSDRGSVADRSTDGSLVTTHAQTDQLVNRLVNVSESLSASFGRWEEEYVSGPSLYFVVVVDANYEEYADPLGTNRWPTDVCRVATDDIESFVTAAEEVAFSCDGAVVVMVDGTLQERMVRIRSPSVTEVEQDEAFDYADWMGTKHLSAVEISTRKEVLTAVTLSEENGRVTVFDDGSYEDRTRDELGGRWRVRQ
jgi:hypothetical protein